MRRFLKLAIVALVAVVVGAFAIGELSARDARGRASGAPLKPDSAFVSSTACPQSPAGFNADVAEDAAPLPEDSAGALRVRGDAAAVALDLRQVTMTDALCALVARFDMRYRSAIALNGILSGTYAGSLARVIGRILDGYDYAIKHEGSTLDVIVFSRSRGLAAPAPDSPVKPAAITPARCGRSAGHRAACRRI